MKYASIGTLTRGFLVAVVTALLCVAPAHAEKKSKKEEKKERKEILKKACVFEDDLYEGSSFAYTTGKIRNQRKMHCMKNKLRGSQVGQIRDHDFEVRGLKFKTYQDEPTKKRNKFTGD